MAYHTRKEIYSPTEEGGFGFTRQLSYVGFTHIIDGTGSPVSFLNFPLDMEDSVIIETIQDIANLSNNVSKIIKNDSYIITTAVTAKIKDYNIGDISSGDNTDFYSEVEIDNSFKINIPAGLDPSKYDERGLGRVYILQRLLKPNSNIDIDRTFNNILFTKFYETIKERSQYNQISDLSPEQWKSNFLVDSKMPETNWLFRPSSYKKGLRVSYGNVFFDKKTASYCISVLINEKDYQKVNNDIRKEVLDVASETLQRFLNFSIPLIFGSYNIPLYFDSLEIIDINTEQYKKGQKIKFLVSLAHRKVAHLINSNAVGENIARRTLSYLVSDSPQEFLANAFKDMYDAASPETRRFMDTIYNRQLNVFIQNKFEEWKNKAIQDLSNFSPLLGVFAQEFAKGILSDISPVDEKIDKKTPFIYFNFRKEAYPDITQIQVKALEDFLSFRDELFKRSIAPKYDVTPTVNLGTLKSKTSKLLENLYDYSLNKIVAKESTGISTAQDKIIGTALYLNGVYDSDSFWQAFYNDAPDFMKVIGVDIFYSKGDSTSVITLGSTKESDYSKVSELNDKSIIFLYYAINELVKEEISGTKIEYVDSALDVTDFIKNYLYPSRTMIWKPEPDEEGSAKKCLANQLEALKDEAKKQTATLRNSIYKSVNGVAGSVSRLADGDTYKKISDDFTNEFGSSPEEFLFAMLGNIDTTTLIASIVECLKKKGWPIEEIQKLIDLLVKLYYNNFNLLCMIPPIKLPQIPSLDLNFELKSVDIMGALYKALRKTLITLINNLIAELFRMLLDQILDCEGAFADKPFAEALGLVGNSGDIQPSQGNSNPNNANANNNGGGGTPPIGSQGAALTSEETTIVKTSFSGVQYGNLQKDSLLIDRVLPEISGNKEKYKPILVELKQAINTISSNLSTPDLLNLLTGNSSDEVYWYVKDTVLAEEQYVELRELESFKQRENFDGLFIKLGSLLDQEVLEEVRATTVEMVTDVNILCQERKVENVQEALFLAQKFGEERVETIRRKITKKQTDTINMLEKFLKGGNFGDMIPPIRSRINPDGSKTKGLLPDEPHESEIDAAKEGVKSAFDTLKTMFNDELKVSKYSQLSSITFTEEISEDLAKKIHGKKDYEDSDDKEKKDKRTRYSNIIQVAPLLRKGLKTRTNTYYKFALPIPDFTDQINNLNNTSDFDGKGDIVRSILTANTALLNASNSIKDYISLNTFALEDVQSTKINESSTGRLNRLTCLHNDLFGKNEVTFESISEYKEETKQLIENLKAPPNVGIGDYPKKIFGKILYNNNIKINLERNSNLIKNPIYNIDGLNRLYSRIYDQVKKYSEDILSRNILEYPIMNLNRNTNKANILNLQIESFQTEFCMSKGFKDTHLLKLSEEQEKIIKYYVKNSFMDKPSPEDGSESEELQALEFAKLSSYINIFFRIFVYDFFMRGIYAFDGNIDEKIVEEFLYNVFLNDKYSKKLVKYTKEGKFIKLAYEKENKKENSTLEEAYRYYIKNNISLVNTTLKQKIGKSNLFIETNSRERFLDKVYNSLRTIIVDDENKTFTFRGNARGDRYSTKTYKYLGLNSEDVFLAKILKRDKKTGEWKNYIGAFVGYENYSNADLYYINEYGLNQSIITYNDVVFGQKYILNILTRVKTINGVLDKEDKINNILRNVYDDLFNTKSNSTFLTIACMGQSSMIRDVRNIFNNTKIITLRSIEYLIFNDYRYSSQDEEMDDFSIKLSVYIKAAIALPIVLVKGIAEAVDPNIAFSSKISLAVKVAKGFLAAIPGMQKTIEAIPDIPTPVISLPLGFAFPFLFTPLTIAYLSLYGSGEDEKEEQDDLENSMNGSDGNLCFCEVDPEPDEEFGAFIEARKNQIMEGQCKIPPITKS